MGHRDLHRLDAHIGEHFNCIVHGFAGTGNDGLGRAVFVGHSHIAVNAHQFGLYTVHRGRDRGHFAVVFYLNFGHYLPAGANSLEAVFKIKNAGSHGGGVFAQAVAHDHIRLNTERGQEAHHGNVCRKHGGLRHFGLFNGGFAHGDLFFGFAGFAPEGIGQVLSDNV